MADPLDLSGKAVIVTGGCRGVGRGITERFLAAGADVVICCRHEPETMPRSGDREALFIAGDVREPEAIDKVVGFTEERLGRIDVLVNNAGGSPPADSATASPKFSNAIISNAVMQQQSDGGVVINVASVSGMRPSPGTAAYGAAKAGLLNLTQTLAMDYAPKVRVNAVTAGLVKTEQSHLFYGDEEGIAAVGATVPLGRMAEPSDVADVCLFLASPLARYVSGESIVVHGGGERPSYLDAAKNTSGS
jgi:NAD(P)-dependent dehydrogenase (short-subunit alcohol dehydrogenase family)